MAWHPTLDDIERRPDGPLTRPRRRDPSYAEGTSPYDSALGAPGCWCGGPYPHDWPGKGDGVPHPREAAA